MEGLGYHGGLQCCHLPEGLGVQFKQQAYKKKLFAFILFRKITADELSMQIFCPFSPVSLM